MTSSLTELRPPPTRPSPPPTRVRSRPSGGWYWVARDPGCPRAHGGLRLGTVGTITALDRVEDFNRVTVPGSMTVFMADPGTKVVYHESPAELARYADPTATGRPAIPYNPATDATIEVSNAATTPTWQQLGLQVTGPDGAVVPVHTYRSTARYDVDPGRLGQAVAKFDATTTGPYRVSAARATEAGGRLAVGDNFARTIAATALGAASLGLATVLATVLIAVVTYRARSRTAG